MRILLIGLYLTFLFSPLSLAAPQPGFDCSRASSPVEKAICQDAMLAERERRCGPSLKAGEEKTGIGCLRELYAERLTTLARATGANSPPSEAAKALRISPAELPAAGRQTTYLDVPTPGRYAISTHSKTGVALELVDYMNGPVARDGAPGRQDGRLNHFLDQGRYKLLLHGAPEAQDKVTVTAQAYTELQITPRRLSPLELISTDLGDVQQRSYWLEVQGREPVFLEAGGRYLEALHLWRDGVTLLDMNAERRTLEPQAGQPLTVLTFDNVLEPGWYRVTLYGGPEQTPWTQPGASRPLYLRLGVPRIDTATRHWRRIGPLGRDRFIITAASDYGRLELPAATALEGESTALNFGGRKGAVETSFNLTKQTRQPVWETPFNPNMEHLVTVRGREGQGYVWQNFKRVSGDSEWPQGDAWLSLLSSGDERDEMPLTAVLVWARHPNDAERPDWQVLASNAPRFGKESVWRGRFNLIGPTELLLEITNAGDFEIRSEAGAFTATIKPLLLGNDPTIKARSGPRWSLETGFYRLQLTPAPDRTGSVELSFGAAGLAADGGQPVTLTAPRFALRKVPHPLRLLLNQRPQVKVGLLRRDLPPTLDQPLFVPLTAAETLAFDAVVPAKGVLSAWDEQGQAQPLAVGSGAAAENVAVEAGTRSIRLQAPLDRNLALSLRWQPDAVATAPPPAELVRRRSPELPHLNEAQPLALDWVADRQQQVRVDIQEPGLFRLETLGRLQTTGRLQTALQPRIATAEANGVGHNFLIQTYLRPGAYVLEAASQAGTTGRAALSLRRTPLRDGGELRFATPVRVTLAAGEGIAYWLEAPAPGGQYQFQAVGLAQKYRLRLEDAEGWPMTPPGQMGTLTAALPASRYRLIVLPTDIAGQVLVNAIAPTPEAAALAGHGPHPLALNHARSHRWLEPAREGEARDPDQWRFELDATTALQLQISEGMRAELQHQDVAQQWKSMARFSEQKTWRRSLPAGSYRVLAEAESRNHQLDYTLSAHTTQLLPDQWRRLKELSATLAFTLARDQVVELSSRGRRDVRATLQDAGGRVLARSDDRADGWDFLISRQLAAGNYQLRVEAVEVEETSGDSDAEPEATDESGETASAEETESQADEEPPEVQDAERNEALAEQEVQVMLHLPTTADAPPLVTTGAMELADGQVRTFVLDHAAASGQIFTARSAAELSLALEEQSSGDQWQVLDTAAGRSAWLAVAPATQPGAARRLRVWGHDGGQAPILLQSRLLTAAAQSPGNALNWQRIDGIEPPLGVARLTLPTTQALRLSSADTEVRSASDSGAVFQAVAEKLLFPQTTTLWLIKPLTAGETLSLTPVVAAGETPLPLTLPAAREVRLPAPAVKEGRVIWRVESRLGQPGIDAGSGMGVAANSAVAVGDAPEVRLWNAGDRTTALPVQLRRYVLRQTADETLDFGMKGLTLAPGEARRLRLPTGWKRWRLDLPARVVAVTSGGTSAARTLWSGDQALSYALDSDAETLWLASLDAAPVAVAWHGASLGALSDKALSRLEPGLLLRRFEPTPGSVALPAVGADGLELVVAGPGAIATVLTADGQVRRGNRIPLSGAAQVLLTHGVGLWAAWLAGAGSNPWPPVAAQPTPVPAVLALQGAAQALQFEFSQPVLLSGRGFAPLLAGIRHEGQPFTPTLYPQGAGFAHYLPAGRSELLLLPPQEGELNGLLELQASTVEPIGEGLGAPVLLSPGSARLFGFEVTRPGRVGVGVQAVPDTVTSRLLDAQGQPVGAGVVQMPTLNAGHYLLEVSAPPTSAPVQVRPALAGIAPPPVGPPLEVRQRFRALLKTPDATSAKRR